jgi:S-formylglutathione hydrolase
VKLLFGAIQERVASIRTLEDLAQADFGVKTLFAPAAAWSPNPTKPPFYLDLPVEKGEQQPLVLPQWAANMPLVTLHQYIPNIRQLKGLAFDAGHEHKSIAASIKVLDQVLTGYGIAHVYEEYQGNHINRVAERIEVKMLPFFAEKLSFAQPKGKGRK